MWVPSSQMNSAPTLHQNIDSCTAGKHYKLSKSNFSIKVAALAWHLQVFGPIVYPHCLLNENHSDPISPHPLFGKMPLGVLLNEIRIFWTKYTFLKKIIVNQLYNFLYLHHYKLLYLSLQLFYNKYHN